MRFARAFAVAALAGCGPGEDTSVDTGDTGPAAPTAAEVQAVLDDRCLACHQGQFADGGMDLTQGVAVVIDVASTQVPSMVRVSPGSLEDSYLWHKVSGTAASVGGEESQMPFDGTAPLSQAELDTIAGWIEAGAPQ